MEKKIRVFAPATVANVTCGFDVLGFALNQPGDEVIVNKNNTGKVRIIKIEGDNGKLPLEAEKNTVAIGVIQMLQHIQSDQGIDIHLIKKMPLGSGLGSSAASAVAGVFAANELLEKPLSISELLPFVMEGERLACGTAHADNVAPSLMGGFVLIRSYDPLEIVPLPTPPDLFASVIHPHLQVNTKDARNILKKEIMLKDAVVQYGNIAGFVTGLLTSDYGLMGRSMKDIIVEPARSVLIPSFKIIKQEALSAGAIGFGISGSGPSLFSLCKGEESATKVASAMQGQFTKMGIDSNQFVSPVNRQGPRILEN